MSNTTIILQDAVCDRVRNCEDADLLDLIYKMLIVG